MIDYHAGFVKTRLFDFPAAGIVHFGLFLARGGRVPGSECRGFLEAAVGKLSPFGADDDVGAGLALDVEPPVVPGGQLEGDFLVLKIVLADEDRKAVGSDEAQRLSGLRCFFLPACSFVLTDPACLGELGLDAGKIRFGLCRSKVCRY